MDDDTILGALAPVRADRTLGRYELLVPVGRGGMAVVWAARKRGSRGFSTIVAVKVMLPRFSADARFERLFLNEARIASAIRHPNVCAVEDVGEESGVLYLVLEWVDGESLAALSSVLAETTGDAKIASDVGAFVIAEAARGLEAAHTLRDDQGRALDIVHRDVSPQNILVTPDATVKIVDFGVAKAALDGDTATESGVIKGKAAYVAPEQVNGHAVDARTDVFALGVVLYELTVGRHPFRQDSDLATLLAIASTEAPPRPTDLDASYPTALEEIVMRAVAKDMDGRFESAGELANALDEFLAHGGVSSARTRAESLLSEVLGPRCAARRDRLARADLNRSRPAEPAAAAVPREPTSRATWRNGVAVLALVGAVGVGVGVGRIGRSSADARTGELTTATAPVASSARAVHGEDQPPPPILPEASAASVGTPPLAPRSSSPPVGSVHGPPTTSHRASPATTPSTHSAAPAPVPSVSSSAGAPFRDPGF